MFVIGNGTRYTFLAFFFTFYDVINSCTFHLKTSLRIHTVFLILGIIFIEKKQDKECYWVHMFIGKTIILFNNVSGYLINVVDGSLKGGK